MDFGLIGRLIADKLRDRTTYVVALVVGTLISAYGHLLVPWIRHSDPFVNLSAELEERPLMMAVSLFLAYAFPMCVGIYSTVAARYKNRRIESIADFPERKPDPVFRATESGQLVEVGARTQEFFQKYAVDRAQTIVGEDAWDMIVTDKAERVVQVYFEPENMQYLVSHSRTAKDELNVYLTRLPAA